MVLRTPLLFVAGMLAGLFAGCGSTGEAPESVEANRPGARQPAVTTTIRVDERPKGGTAVAVGEGSVWVASGGGCSASVAHVDPERNEVVARIPFDVVTDVAVGAGAVWAAGSLCTEGGNEGAVFRVDPRSDEVVATIPLDCAHDLSTPDCFPSDVAADESGVWVTLEHDPTAGEVVRIDPATNEVVARIPIQGWPRDVVVGEGAVWVFVLTEFDGETVEAGTLLRIDPGSDKVVATLLRGELLPGGGTEIAPMLAVGEHAVWAWAQEWQPRFANVAVKINAQTNEVTRERIAVDHFFPFAVAEGGVWFIGSSGERAALARLNARTLEVDQSVVLGITPIDAAFDQAGDRVWVADYWPSVVRVDLR